MVRNAYLHAFGGVYADLDMLPLDSTSDHLAALFPQRSLSAANVARAPFRMAYVGRMGTESFEHSIPNAWMASSAPGHNFWLRPMDTVVQYIEMNNHAADVPEMAPSPIDRRSIGTKVGPEAVTGPVALRQCLLDWDEERETREASGQWDQVRVLPEGKVCHSPASPSKHY
jgi:hypothetical protein